MTVTKSAERVSPTRILYLLVLASFVFALIYVPLRALVDEGYRAATEYKIIIFQLAMGVVFLRLPYLLSRLLSISIAGGLSASYVLFLWCAIFLGEFAYFYYRVPVWDSLLHIFSAALLTVAVLSLTRLSPVPMSPFICALLAVGASVLVGVLWEVYEFTFDGILGLNMQKFAAPSATGSADALRGAHQLFIPDTTSGNLVDLTGRAALTDTMTDLILDLVASVAVGVLGYFRLCKSGELPRPLRITKATPQTTDVEAQK